MTSGHLTIGEVARAVDVAPSTLRYYDEIGLVTPAARVSGHRRYDAAAVTRLRIVAQCQRAGFSLDEIRRLLDDDGDWQELARRKLDDLDHRIAALQDAQDLVRSALACGCAHLERCGRATHAQAGGPKARADHMTSL